LPDIGIPLFFKTPAEWRSWLKKNHDKEKELWVGFHKKGSGRPSITWPQSVDEALCFGWIDGIRKSLGDESYVIRFTPRKKGSIWSDVNTRRVAELTAAKKMHAAGLEAFRLRDPRKAGIYSFERRHNAKLTAEETRKFKANKKAWEHFQATAPGYRSLATFRVASAKRQETRARRLASLIADCAAGRKIGVLRRPGE
jgi:uncharacterized protein YdeI (YjbR/CyaY-like superfamily)